MITTQGGWVDATFAVVDAIEAIDAPVNVWAVGGVYSAGAVILASGTGKRVAGRHAILMVHVNLTDPQADRYSSLKLERFERFWKEHARLPADWFPMTEEAAYYISPQEALELGIIDEIAERGSFP